MEGPAQPTLSPEDSPGGYAKHYLSVLLKRKWIALGFFVFVLAAVVIQTKRQIPEYQSTSTILIERKPPRVLAGTAEVVELGNTNYWSNKEYYQTQYRIIQSHEISSRVVKRLGLLNDDRFLPEEEDLPEEARETGQPLSVDELASVLASRINVKPVKDSMLVEISIRDKDARLATELANAVAQAYLDYNLDYKQRAVAQADRELERLVQDQKALKETAEKHVVEFETRERVGTVTNERKVIDQAILSGEIELDTIRREKDRVQGRLKSVRRYKKAPDIFSVPLPEVLSNHLIRQLKQDYVRLASERAKLETTYLDKHPLVLSVRQRMSVLLEAARKEVANVVEAAEFELEKLDVQEANLVTRLAEFRKGDVALADRQIEHDRLLAIRAQARQAYEKVNKRLIETKMTGEISVNNVHLLDIARVPDHPVSPNMKLNVLLGILMGLFGGAVAAFVVDFMDNTIKTREEVENLIGLNFLGLVPTLNERTKRGRKHEEPYEGPIELLVHYRPMSTVAEFSRSIRTNLRFVSPDSPLRTILVTSPSPQEGKTTLAVNLGINMAAAGGRTVIVDTDLRRPRLHEAFTDEKPHVGVSNYLIGSDSVERFCQRTEVENLDILPCGPCPPNPAELLHTERFHELIEDLKGLYDNVIFDSPPVNVVTDPQIIGNTVDGVVLVAKCGKTTRESLRHSKRQLEQVNARILGCVMNDLDLEQRAYGYYYYSRGHYGYTYGEDGGDA